MEDKLYKLMVEGNKILFVEASGYTSDDNEELETALDSDVYVAAVRTSPSSFVDVFEEFSEEQLMRKTPEKNNIIHVSVRHHNMEFLMKAVKRFPVLIGETNNDGDNPLHLAAQTGNLEIIKLLVDSYKSSNELERKTQPWRMKNRDGNTPLHVALIRGKTGVAMFLVEEDGKAIARIRNNRKETPLHLAVKHRVDRYEQFETARRAMKLVSRKIDTVLQKKASLSKLNSIEVIEELLSQERLVACWRDVEGMTPLHRAATLDPPYYPAIKEIILICPESTEVHDGSGKTILHLMNNLCNNDFNILRMGQVVHNLINVQDKDGNTPVITALQNQNIPMFSSLVILDTDLTLRNKDGISLPDLILQQHNDDIWGDTSQTDTIKDGESLNQERRILDDEDGHNNNTFTTDENNAICKIDIDYLKTIIQKNGKSFLAKKSFNKQNFLHALFDNFPSSTPASLEILIYNAIEIMPSLLIQLDSMDRSPFHYIAKKAPHFITTRFILTVKSLLSNVRNKETLTYEHTFHYSPWTTKDKFGKTPLHLASDKGRLESLNCIIRIIEDDCDEAAAVDANGETILHVLSDTFSDDLLAKRKILRKGLEKLIKLSPSAMHKVDHKHGYTALLKAAKHQHLYLTKLLCFGVDTQGKVDLDLYGNSFWHLLADINLSDIKQKVLREELGVVGNKILLHKDNEGNTALHLAIKNCNFSFALIFSEIVYRNKESLDEILEIRNNDDNTPLHLVRGTGNAEMEFVKYAMENTNNLDNVVGICNNELNTALHVAILNDDQLASIMIKHMMKNPSSFGRVASICNKDGNTILHQTVSGSKIELAVKIIEGLVATPSSFERVASICNEEGNTVLHQTISESKIELAEKIIEGLVANSSSFERVASICNQEGNTILHQAISESKIELAEKIIKCLVANPSLFERLASVCNNDGNTPLHLAILKGHFNITKLLIESATNSRCLDKVLVISNKKDETPNDLIGSAHNLDYQFESFLWRKPEVAEAMLGVRSLSGVSTETIKDYTNTIGLVAALLATMSFTVAFTMPGGLNSDNGTPVLIKRAAFQVFMVSDILAMCCSMMSLFCLLWIMTIGNKKHQVVLLDLTMFLLEGAFYTTIMTFMTGLYASVYPVNHWIAILACVLCSLVIALMRKGFIIGLIPRFIRIYVWFRKTYAWIRMSSKHMSCCCLKNVHNQAVGSGNDGQTNQQTEETTQIVIDKPLVQPNRESIPLVSKICAFFSSITK